MSEQQAPLEAPSKTVIQEALERILAHVPFARSPVLSRFLKHVVEHALSADGPPLKEYAIGLEVFDRPDDFDPRIDTIVRVQAGRLRTALKRYYAGEGVNDAVQLDMPAKQYGIRARWRQPDHQARADEEDETPVAPHSFMLAAPRTALIGREHELQNLARRLNGKSVRMLSIIGVGGTGKTRVALALADRVRARYPGGVLFLDLSTVRERTVLLGLLADLFNVRKTAGEPLLQVLAEHLREDLVQPTLLVLDSMEGVLRGADVLGAMLDASAMLTMVVTSRVALRMYGENVCIMPPLAVPGADPPADPAALSRVPAVQLFLERAAAANPHADWQAELDSVAELCTRLDGLPLAIELVAAQASVLNPRQMLQRFTGHLDLPPNPARDAPSRQRSLRRVMDFSFELLDEPARISLRRLSVFAGGFTLEAAEAVADAPADLGSAVLLPALDRLVSLGLVYLRDAGGEPRYAMLDTLRVYARERLAANNEGPLVHQAHAAWCVLLAEEGVARLNIAQREAWLARCDLEQDNFRQALAFLIRHGPSEWALRLGYALFPYWERREKLIEGRRQLERIVAACEPVESNLALWTRVGAGAASFAAFHGDHDSARTRFERLLKLHRRAGDRKGEAMVLNTLGVTAQFVGDNAGARDYYAQTLRVCRRMDDQAEIAAALSNLAESELRLGNAAAAHELLSEARALFVREQQPVPAAWCANHLGDVARAGGDYAAADGHYAVAEDEFRSLDDSWGVARTQLDRGLLALEKGDQQQALPRLLRALERFEVLDYRRGTATATDGLAAWALQSGDAKLAVQLLAAARAWRIAIGFVLRPAEGGVEIKAIRQQACAQLDSAAVQALQQAGARMTPGAVVRAIRAVTHTSPD